MTVVAPIMTSGSSQGFSGSGTQGRGEGRASDRASVEWVGGETMVVLTTGDPVPDMLERRGPFSEMIRVAASGAHSGPVMSIDARGELPRLPGETKMVVITGSSAHVMDRDPWVIATERWLGEVVERGVPTLGICFGHQLLAMALGGDVQKNPRGREIGTIDIEILADDPITVGAGPRFRANATHLDTVSRLPPGAVALARSSRDDHQIIRFARRCYGFQFHPEIDREIMLGYFSARRPVLEAELLDVDHMMTTVEDAPMAVSVFESFVRLATE